MSFQSVDWARLLAELSEHGCTLAQVAARTGIAPPTLRDYIAGSHPNHPRGDSLVRLWCATLGRDWAQAPMMDIDRTGRRLHRAGVDRRKPPDLSE